jgi:hypothetical protein
MEELQKHPVHLGHLKVKEKVQTEGDDGEFLPSTMRLFPDRDPTTQTPKLSFHRIFRARRPLPLV